MSKTWRSEGFQPQSPPRPTNIEEDEDVDPRSYNVFQRSNQERDSFRLEETVPDEA
jgi:hypothetical protein